eukprot:CFRG3914T1
MSGQPVVDHVLLVEFHHKNGPQIQFCYPTLPGQSEGSSDLPDEWKLLPFMALPDGGHNTMKDTIYFHLPCIDEETSSEPNAKTMFCVASFRQIASNLIENKESDVTRSYVQKSVVFMSRLPIYSVLATKLDMFSEILFAQRDFSSVVMLKTCFEQVTSTSNASVLMKDLDMALSGSLRCLVKKFRYKLIILIKLLLLEKRVLGHGTPVGTLCDGLVSLVSLIPGLIETGLDGVSSLTSSAFHRESYVLRDNDSAEQRLNKRLGLPLVPFGMDCLFQPYVTLQGIDQLFTGGARSFLVGTTNALLLSHNKIPLDAVIDFAHGTIDIKQSSLEEILSPTIEDLRFMEKIVSEVDATWSSGSEDNRGNLDEGSGYEDVRTFNSGFVNAWSTTCNYAAWKSVVESSVLSSVTSGHPWKGKFTLADMKIRMNNKIHDNLTDEQLAEMRKQSKEAGLALQSAQTEVAAAWLSAKSNVTGWFTKKMLEYEAYQTKHSSAPSTSSPMTDNANSGAPGRPANSPPAPGRPTHSPPEVFASRPNPEKESNFLCRTTHQSSYHAHKDQLANDFKECGLQVGDKSRKEARPPPETTPRFLQNSASNPVQRKDVRKEIEYK